MTNQFIKYTAIVTLLTGGITGGCATKSSDYHREETVKTEAGDVDFHTLHHIKFPSVFHKITNLYAKENSLELDDGSKWAVSKVDAVKGWDSNRVTLCQNQATLSTHRFALLNTDLKLAIPVSLVREPIPNKDKAFFVKSIDRANDIIVLNDGKRWIVHSSDSGSFSKINEHDRIIIGANVSDSRDKSPYILIDTANNNFVRASLIE